MSDAETADVVSGYAARFSGRLPGGHAVVSPLGLWLLLALLGPATAGAARRDLEAVLGTTIDDAAARARALLDQPHPAVAALTAVWDRRLGPAFDAWVQTLPEAVARGPMPDQTQADIWAQTGSRGLIDRFPLRIDDMTRLVLASALVTDMRWRRPLDSTDELGGEFGRLVSRGLYLTGGIQLVAETDAAGPVAVAAPGTVSALDVLSVIAAPDVAAPDVHAAAHQVATMLRGDARAARPIPPEDLTDGHAWRVTERREPRFGGPDVQFEWVSHLPAWAASSDHDLLTAPGVPLVVEALTEFVVPQSRPVEIAAQQTAVATYAKTGFTAAAVTAIDVSPTGGLPRSISEALVRRIEIRFNRPHAVLALAAHDDGPPAWRGVPVFSAWVAEPREVPAEKIGKPTPVAAPTPTQGA